MTRLQRDYGVLIWDYIGVILRKSFHDGDKWSPEEVRSYFVFLRTPNHVYRRGLVALASTPKTNLHSKPQAQFKP